MARARDVRVLRTRDAGGELSRVMLALKTVLADLDEVPLLVFDEVDANVGGEIGRVVGGTVYPGLMVTAAASPHNFASSEVG